MWLWRRLEKVGWRDRARHQDVPIKVDEGRSLIRTMWKAV